MNKILEQVNTVIFDMDGTILDSEPLHARAIQKVFKRYNISMEVFSIMETYVGQGDNKVYKHRKELHNLVTHKDFISQKDEAVLDVVNNMNSDDFEKLFADGFRDFLTSLQKDKFNIALVSASSRFTVDLFLKKANILEHFPLTITADEVYKTKPSPACYFEAMRFYNSTSKDTLIFEDSESGLNSALATGSKVIAMDFSLKNEKMEKQFNNHQLQCHGNYLWLSR